MPSISRHPLDNGMSWYTGAGITGRGVGEIIVPECDLEGMSNEEVGRYVVSLRRAARATDASELIHHLADDDTIRGASDSHLLTFAETLAEFVGSDDDATKFYGLIVEEFDRRHTPRPKRVYVSNKAPIPADIRWAVWKRDDFTCKECGTREHLSVDHIIPESKGGTLDMDNLQTLCKLCNSRKGARV